MILIVLSGMLALGVTLLGTPLLIKVLTRRNLAQSIRESGDGIVYRLAERAVLLAVAHPQALRHIP